MVLRYAHIHVEHIDDVSSALYTGNPAAVTHKLHTDSVGENLAATGRQA
jgi:hypothetical protein